MIIEIWDYGRILAFLELAWSKIPWVDARKTRGIVLIVLDVWLDIGPRVGFMGLHFLELICGVNCGNTEKCVT